MRGMAPCYRDRLIQLTGYKGGEIIFERAALSEGDVTAKIVDAVHVKLSRPSSRRSHELLNLVHKARRDAIKLAPLAGHDSDRCSYGG